MAFYRTDEFYVHMKKVSYNENKNIRGRFIL